MRSVKVANFWKNFAKHAAAFYSPAFLFPARTHGNAVRNFAVTNSRGAAQGVTGHGVQCAAQPCESELHDPRPAPAR